jgi:hypothetical protein|tara:strand:- start:190 stop:423 length:234 start_codon:yes stop_codon:yes gene_type:complete
MIFKHLNIKLFIISLTIGLLYIYLSEDYKKVIYIHPNPNNIDKYQYQDKSDECFGYTLEKVKCPKKKEEYNNISIQK